jgi:MFS family permease
MNSKVIAVFYIALWVGVAAVLAYLGAAAGYSPWMIGGGVLVAFFFINGSLAYVFRSRQLRREGKQPPTYAKYLFQTEKFQAGQLSEPMRFPAPIRVALGLIVTLGGAFFIVGGGLFVFHFDRLSVLVIGLCFVALGIAFAYLGYRVFIMGKRGRRLLGPLGLRIASYITAFLSAFAAFGAVVSAEYLMGFSALGGALFAFLLYRSSQSAVHGMPPNHPLPPTPEGGAAERTR